MRNINIKDGIVTEMVEASTVTGANMVTETKTSTIYTARAYVAVQTKRKEELQARILKLQAEIDEIAQHLTDIENSGALNERA